MPDEKEDSKLGAVAPHHAAPQPPEGPQDSSPWPRGGAASPVASPTGKGPSGPPAPPKKKTPSRGKRAQAGAQKRKKAKADAAPSPTSAAVLRRAAAVTPRAVG